MARALPGPLVATCWGRSVFAAEKTTKTAEGILGFVHNAATVIIATGVTVIVAAEEALDLITDRAGKLVSDKTDNGFDYVLCLVDRKAGLFLNRLDELFHRVLRD